MGAKEGQLPLQYTSGVCWMCEVARQSYDFSGGANDLLRNSAISIFC